MSDSSLIELLPHQYDTIEYLENKCINQKGLLVYHHLGTGKTLTGLVWLSIVSEKSLGDYIIVCPDLVKSSWINESKKINFKINPSKIINYNYLRLMIESDSKSIKDKYVIFDEVHNIIPIILNLRSEKRYYLKINEYLTSSRKNLLLSGTPFSELVQISVLVNLCSNEPFMPIDDYTFNEKYSIVSKKKIEENKKNPIYFNYIKPIMYKSSEAIFNNVVFNYINTNFGSDNTNFSITEMIKENVMRLIHVPLQLFIINKIKYRVYDVLKYFSFIERYFGRFNIVSKLLNFFNKGEESVNKLNEIREYVNNTSKFNMIQSIITIGFNFLLAFIVWKIIYMLYEKIQRLFKGPGNKIPNSGGGYNINYSKISEDIKNYVSFYKYEDDADYADIINIPAPIVTVLSLRIIYITIEYYMGQLSIDLFSFISQKPKKDIKLDKNLMTSYEGYELYGRCISNLPDFIESIVIKTDRFKIDEITGVVSADYITREEIISKSSTKIQNLGDILVKINGTKKIVIYSDYIEQGAYLVSLYLNARGIKHLYLNKTLLLENRNALINNFNKDYEYTIIILDKESKEGISLLNIEELHFLEPPVDYADKEQVIGRAIRFQSHKDLKKEDRIVKIYKHMGSLFETTTDKISFFNKLKEMKLTSILYEFLRDMCNNYTDDIKITTIIHSVKKEHFNGVLQTTINPYIDKLLDLDIKRTVQGFNISGKRKHKSKLSRKMIEEDKRVVLSIDEHCYQKDQDIDYYVEELADNIKNNSILSENFTIIKKYNCIKNKTPFNISFKKKKINRKNSSKL